MGANRTVGGFTCAPGNRVSGVQKVSVAGQQVPMPLFLINGGKEGSTLAVTAGIHGAEYASIEAALRLGRSLRPIVSLCLTIAVQ